MNRTTFIIIFITQVLVCLPFQQAVANPLESLPKNCHFSSQFEQTKKLVSLPVPLQSSGNIYFSCQAGLIWQTKLPIQEELVLTQQNLHFQQNGTDETSQLETIDSLQTEFLSKLLIGLMSVDENYIRQTFVVEAIAAKQFQLTPKSNILKKVITSITISSSPDKKELFILIAQTDQTELSIRSYAPIVFNNSNSHMTQCRKSTHSELLCEALFNPINTATFLDDNAN